MVGHCINSAFSRSICAETTGVVDDVVVFEGVGVQIKEHGCVAKSFDVFVAAVISHAPVAKAG